MTDDEVVSDSTDSAIFSNPRPALIIGIVSAVGAYVASRFEISAITVLPLLVALLATGIAVSIAPRSWWVLGSAAVVSLVSMLTAEQSRWDPSAVLLFWLLAVFAGVCGLVVTLPSVLQRVLVSVVIVFHFGGILTAITAAPPQSWVSDWLWGHVYRPYLQFMYLNNAYHFYSPEPGPATLLWFRVEYEPDDDGTTYYRWVKLPDLDEDGRPIEFDELGMPHRIPNILYTRRLSMAEMTNTKGEVLDPRYFERLKEQRVLAGHVRGIPVAPSMVLNAQYLEPNNLSKRWIASYTRHVALSCKHTLMPDKPVVGIKVYRITHNIVNYRDMASASSLDGGRRVPGKSLSDPTLYVPVYMGEFESSGEMKKSCRETAFDQDGRIYDVRRDPFLYWIIPNLKKHAGDVDEAEPQSRDAGNIGLDRR